MCQWKIAVPWHSICRSCISTFEGSGEEKLWACQWMEEMRQQKIRYNKLSLEEPLVVEFSIHLYRIQDAKYFNDGTAIKFWEIFYKIFDFMDDEAFILRFNTLKILEL